MSLHTEEAGTIPAPEENKRDVILAGKKQFFLVWSPQGETPPRFVHDTHGAALRVAAIMAKTHPGLDFFLMKAKAVFRSDTPGRYFNLKKAKANGQKGKKHDAELRATDREPSVHADAEGSASEHGDDQRQLSVQSENEQRHVLS